MEPDNVSIKDDNTVALLIHNNSLYYSTQKDSPPGIYSYGTMPTTAGAHATPVITNVSGQGVNTYGFAISPDGTVAYLADGGGDGFGVQKFTYSSGSWTHDYDFGGVGGAVTGLAVDFSTPNPTIFSVSPTRLCKIVDTGSSAAVTTLVTVGDTTHYAFRGLSFARRQVQFPGDANYDGTVDINDLTIVLRTSTSPPG